MILTLLVTNSSLCEIFRDPMVAVEFGNLIIGVLNSVETHRIYVSLSACAITCMYFNCNLSACGWAHSSPSLM